jgi:hypothetical protein
MPTALHALAQLTVVLVLVVYLWRGRCLRAVGWGATAVGFAAFLAGALAQAPEFVDYDIFMAAGRDVLAGRDPYLHGMALNTPQATGLFAGAAALPPDVPRVAMRASFLVGSVVLVWFGAAAVRPPDRPLAVPPHVLGVIAAALALSFSYRYGMELGQLGMLTAAGLLGAVAARRSGRPVLAGVGLFVGSIKIATTAPFLLLFRARRDVRAWLAFVALALASTLLTVPPGEVVERCRNCLALIEREAQPGGANDVTRGNSSAVEIVSLDRLAHCLGLPRGPARAVNAALVAALGVGLAVVVARRRLDEPALVAVVSVYACLFLYHRVYDTVVLAGTLVWAVDQAVSKTGIARRAAAGAVLLILAVWFPRFGVLRAVEAASVGWNPAAQAVAGVFLAYTTWAVVGAGVLVLIAARAGHAAPSDQSPP